MDIYNEIQQQKEELIKWVEEKIKEINPKKLSNSELYKITSDMKMQRYYAYVNVLLKLKESDKNEKDSSI